MTKEVTYRSEGSVTWINELAPLPKGFEFVKAASKSHAFETIPDTAFTNRLQYIAVSRIAKDSFKKRYDEITKHPDFGDFISIKGFYLSPDKKSVFFFLHRYHSPLNGSGVAVFGTKTENGAWQFEIQERYTM